MPDPFKKRFNQYLYFIKKDRKALLILSGLIVIVIISDFIVKSIEPKSKYDYSGFIRLVEEWEQTNLVEGVSSKRLFVFDPNKISEESLDSLNLSVFVKQNIISYRRAGGSFSKPGDLRKIYGINDSIFSEIEPYIYIQEQTVEQYKPGLEKKNEPEYHGVFDPNKADIHVLRQYGFTKFQAENVVKFRESGGSFHNKSDLLKIYGIDSTLLKSIDKNILIEPREGNKPVIKDTVIRVELNSADTTDLMNLPGIGPVYAQRILKYRELLGGYYAKSQLLEVYNFPLETYQSIEENITVDTVSIKKIRINYAGYSDLTRHPYMDKKVANAILKQREKNGAFTINEQIKSIPEIDHMTYRRIRPYITCR